MVWAAIPQLSIARSKPPWGSASNEPAKLRTEALVWLRHPTHSQILRSLLGRHTLADYQAADALAQRWMRW